MVAPYLSFHVVQTKVLMKCGKSTFLSCWKGWPIIVSLGQVVMPMKHGHSILGGVSVSNTCQTRIRLDMLRTRVRCANLSVRFYYFYFLILGHGWDTAETWLLISSPRKKPRPSERVAAATACLCRSHDWCFAMDTGNNLPPERRRRSRRKRRKLIVENRKMNYE